MMQLLETGKALYVLAGICLMGILTRGLTRRLYKGLLKESTNLTVTKNRTLKELKTRAENAYRVNQGMRDTGAWLEHQLNEMKIMGFTLNGWSGLAMQWTWLCLLAGGTGAFLAYWYRLDTSCMVLYGAGGILMAMLTLVFDGVTAGVRREQLMMALQDYLENVMYPRMARNQPIDSENLASAVRPSAASRGMRSLGRLSLRSEMSRENAESENSENLENPGENEGERAYSGFSGTVMQGGARNSGNNGSNRSGNVFGNGKRQRRANQNTSTSVSGGSGDSSVSTAQSAVSSISGIRNASAQADLHTRQGAQGKTGDSTAGVSDTEYLKRSLEQMAASREKHREGTENWLKDLSPEEVELIGDILKQYLI
ncbi:hypothetical protein [Brotaphodocola sp.]|uniref:hypothetical protein n=1 Tax=Brotaphodocola sp. TaxID=3073577 RepID=UPI003D7EFF95